MALLRRKRKYVAIDYDRRRLRLVAFECRRRSLNILSLHAASIGPTVDIHDPSSMGPFLRKVVARLGLAGTSAIMCVGRGQAVLQSLSLPPTADAGELASMVRFQVSKELPFSADEAVIDYTPGSHWDTDATDQAGDENGTRVLAAAVRVPVIDAARGICEEASLRLQRLGLRPYANMRAVYRCVRATPGERLLLVNLTADEAEISVMCDQTLEFSRSPAMLPVADEQPSTQDDSAQAARRRLWAVRRVVNEVNRSLQSFQAVRHAGPIHACLVAGDTGLEEDLAKALAEKLSVRCELFDPAGGFGIAPSEGVSGFGAALGLAASQAEAALPFDFLNPKRPQVRRDTRSLRAAGIALAAAVVIGSAALAGHSYLSARRDVVAELKRQNDKLKAEKKALLALRRRLAVVDNWLKEDVDWLEQLRVLSATLPPAQEMYLTSLRCSPGRIVIVGRVKNRDVAMQLAEGLMARRGYQVRNKGVNSVRDRHGYGQEFKLEILIDPAEVRAERAATAAKTAAPGHTTSSG